MDIDAQTVGVLLYSIINFGYVHRLDQSEMSDLSGHNSNSPCHSRLFRRKLSCDVALMQYSCSFETNS